MKDLLKQKCVPCEKNSGMKPMERDEALDYLTEQPSWILSDDGKTISKEYKFSDFIGAVNFVNLVADIAEMEGHHPDIHVFYNKVRLDLSTHAIDGLSKNDFIIAAKVDAHRA